VNPSRAQERRIEREMRDAVRGIERLRGATPKKSGRSKEQFAVREIARRLAIRGWEVAAEIPGYDRVLLPDAKRPKQFDILARRADEVALIEVKATVTPTAKKGLARLATLASDIGAVFLVYDATRHDFVDWRMQQ
jgi:hypothetical protein